jgi:predicted RNA binding protein YcfA (HicA-like mRNA interferase family)
VLTSRRLLFKKYSALRDYALDQAGWIEIAPKGNHATVQIHKEGDRPTVLKLERTTANELAANLRRLRCRWTVVA